MYRITPELLREVAGASVNKKVVDGLVKYLPEALEKYKINTKLRIAHFLAQIAHESDHFRTTEEYASGAAYEGRKDLGNVRKGDGRRYKGRGVLQITGRANYKTYGKKIGHDLENNPELAATPEISVLTAAQYWQDRGLNELADADNGKQITRKVNGGYNGLNDRLEKIKRAKRALDKAEKIKDLPARPKQETPKQDLPSRPVEPVEPVKEYVGPLPIIAQGLPFEPEENNG